jgi:transposase
VSKKRRRFAESFKVDAVKLVRETGRSVAKAAEELGISESALRRWLDAAAIEQGDKAGLTAGERAEIRELKRENAVLRMERDILKKVTAFFAKESA